MGVTAKDMINVAKSFIGYNEADGSHKKIIDIYNAHKPLAKGYKVKYTDDWCDTFVSACAIKAGAVKLIGTECGCERHIAIFKKKGIWHENGSETPKIGDLILYNWDDATQPNDGFADHIGIIEKIGGKQITVIEGNKNNCVSRRIIPVGYGYIRGFARPKYDKEPATKVVKKAAPVKKATETPAPTTKVKKSILTIAKEVVAGKWGNGENRVKKLKAAGYDPEQVQKKVNTLMK